MPLAKMKVIPTNIPGLDTLLGGGIPVGSLLIVVGSPGTGKTLLLQQLCFSWTQEQAIENTEASSDETAKKPKAIFFSTLSEPHDKLIQHVGQFEFFDETRLNEQVKLLSLTKAMEQGLGEVADEIVRTARHERATLVTLDSLGGLEDLTEGRGGLRRFLYQLSSQLSTLSITTIVTLERNIDTMNSENELTVADGVIHLTNYRQGVQRVRQAEIRKLRGVNMLDGLHTYQITNAGLTFYPRLESLSETSLNFKGAGKNDQRLSLGLPELEQMLGGGLPTTSSTVVAGSPGTGKTLFNLHYLVAGAEKGEQGLYVGFYESVTQLKDKAQRCGIKLEDMVESGLIDILTITPVELEPDQVMSQIRSKVEAGNIKRVVLDGVIELEMACRWQQRSYNFIAALVNYFKTKEITTCYTYEVAKRVSAELDLGETPFTTLAENLLLFRQVEYQNKLYRVIAILKMRDSAYDSSIREFSIEDDRGIKVLAPTESVRGVLTGIARKLDEDE